MDAIIAFLGALNGLTPLGIIGMLGLIIFMMVKAKDAKAEMDTKVASITDNHLHDLPAMAANLEKTVEVLQRIEVRMGEEFSYIRTKLNTNGR